MAEIQSQKRPRDELEAEIELSGSAIEDPKRQKSSYHHILSILDEDEVVENLSELLTSFEQELSGGGGESTSVASGDEEEGSVESVLRHLLEASDDELGIPNTAVVAADDTAAAEEGGGGELGMCDGLLWELEDEAANYYTLLQSELFL